MEELNSIWFYQENVDGLKEKLVWRTLELESLKMEATEEIRKMEENAKNLQELLKMAYSERDEARTQIQILMESPLFVPTKPNPSITESNNSLSFDSPAGSFFEPVSSPDLSSLNMADNEQFLIDPSLEIIENITPEKPLPKKGKLLQAVMDAGPLLQTLLIAGALPRWRNPPPLEPFKFPSFSTEVGRNLIFDQNQSPHLSFSARKQRISSSDSETLCGSSRMCSAFVLSDKGASTGPCFYVPDGKRHRFQ